MYIMHSRGLISIISIIFQVLLSFAYGSSTTKNNQRRQLPPYNNKDVFKTFTSPEGVIIRYTEPGKKGICETTPGVNSYAGYIDLENHSHTFFWFFEARKNPETAPFTLWLNGGPGSDSLTGVFTGICSCLVTFLTTLLTGSRKWSLQYGGKFDHET